VPETTVRVWVYGVPTTAVAREVEAMPYDGTGVPPPPPPLPHAGMTTAAVRMSESRSAQTRDGFFRRAMKNPRGKRKGNIERNEVAK
jgi:hypothetical protein